MNSKPVCCLMREVAHVFESIDASLQRKRSPFWMCLRTPQCRIDGACPRNTTAVSEFSKRVLICLATLVYTLVIGWQGLPFQGISCCWTSIHPNRR